MTGFESHSSGWLNPTRFPLPFYFKLSMNQRAHLTLVCYGSLGVRICSHRCLDVAGDPLGGGLAEVEAAAFFTEDLPIGVFVIALNP